jgi:hypothetical protein
LIDTITHASKVFRTLDTILKDMPIAKRPRCEHVLLAKPVGTTSDKPINDLAASVKHVVNVD